MYSKKISPKKCGKQISEIRKHCGKFFYPIFFCVHPSIHSCQGRYSRVVVASAWRVADRWDEPGLRLSRSRYWAICCAPWPAQPSLTRLSRREIDVKLVLYLLPFSTFCNMTVMFCSLFIDIITRS